MYPPIPWVSSYLALGRLARIWSRSVGRNSQLRSTDLAEKSAARFAVSVVMKTVTSSKYG
jgi:hypothetical protein